MDLWQFERRVYKMKYFGHVLLVITLQAAALSPSYGAPGMYITGIDDNWLGKRTRDHIYFYYDCIKRICGNSISNRKLTLTINCLTMSYTYVHRSLIATKVYVVTKLCKFTNY